MNNNYIVIKPQRNLFRIPISEIIRYKDLLYFLVWRDLKVRYKQTILGASWALFQPLVQMVIFSIFFGRLAKIPSENVPYPIFVYSALLPWTFFANSLNACNNSVINNAGLITKIYFPRLIIPLSAIGSGLIDLLLSFLVLLGIMAYYNFSITIHFLMIFPLLIGTIFTAIGIGTLLSALSVAYRDFRHIVPFGIQIWLFATPVIYPPSIVGSRFEFLLNLNPMAGIINGFRSAILNRPFSWDAIGISFLISVIIFMIGVGYFSRVEKKFADII